jgi:hypothetical protein
MIAKATTLRRMTSQPEAATDQTATDLHTTAGKIADLHRGRM